MSSNFMASKQGQGRQYSAGTRIFHNSLKSVLSSSENLSERKRAANSNGFNVSHKYKRMTLNNNVPSSFPENKIYSSEVSHVTTDNNRQKSSEVKPAKNSRNFDCQSCENTEKAYRTADRMQNSGKNTLPDYNATALCTLKSRTGFFDSHCHLDFLFNREKYRGTFSDYQAENRKTFPDSYRGCIAVFCKPWTFAKRNIWQKHLSEKNVWAAFGCHPHEAANYNDEVEEALKLALNHPKVRALGEIGLDYSGRNNCHKDVQQAVLRRQLRIARDRKMRLVIHCRDAHEDCLSILKEFLPKYLTFHLHCFTDSWTWAQKWMDAFPNVHIGITNLVTFPSAKDTHEVAKRIPLNRLLLETDAPYFVPKKSPYGTKNSHPGMAIHVAAQIAALRGIDVECVLESTYRNTKNVYNI
ncbi:putative deoxyribonuclease TATDN2 [Caerostris darwini]|uniref:Deoxyribonuclease TATDN2 n=1 Tax=Caerostris darwini TaxID=1538125 RepID=A0AAV4V1M9_9ARAC|nr:putative deoxyribonuclease TATDN2 [Caerostris darwini]